MLEPLDQPIPLPAALDCSTVQPQPQPEPELLIVDLPQAFARMCTYRVLEERLGQRPLTRRDLPVPRTAFLDLSLHPGMPAQTIVDGEAQDWPDLAEGLPEALASADILVILGQEHMLRQTPHRLAAFLQAHARERTVIVLTADIMSLRRLAMRDVTLRIDRSLADGIRLGEAFTPAVERLAQAVLSTASTGTGGAA